jgi:hypothetical protein
MTILSPLPQLWACHNLDTEGIRNPDYDWIVLVTGVRFHNENLRTLPRRPRLSYSTWYIATGKNIGLGNKAIFNKCICVHRDWADNPIYGILFNSQYQRIKSSDLPLYMYLPRKSHLFDRILTGNYPRLKG